jgi:uracil-DNA glycosylase
VKVVILGQDPYHGEGQANGLAFSVAAGVPFPPSLLNIFKELKTDLGIPMPAHGDLSSWASQGVFLLNATLTVRSNLAGSHQNQGWEVFTDEVIRTISRERAQVVFLLWGAFAQKKEELIDAAKHCILKAPHPSPLAAHRGFWGCKHFSKTNDYLLATGQTPIVW